MASKKNVQDAHKLKNASQNFSQQVRVLHGALMSIASAMNRPQRDEQLIREAGIPLDRALFPLLVGIERVGPIGVVDLAERMGRDYTTVSRQVAKLDSLGLVRRQASPEDGRVRIASITPKGKKMTELLDSARERLAHRVFAEWDPQELDDLVRLMRKFADAFDEAPAG